MPLESETIEQSLLQRLIRSRNRDISLFIPFLLSLADPDREPPVPPTPGESRDRIILINPLTQGMVVIEGSSSSLDSLIQDLLNKKGQPPASRSSIEAMASVEISGGGEEDEVGECVICLEEWGVGGVLKEMPCKHRFHGECIEKWLGIHGSCPVCRYKMPPEDDFIKKNGCAGAGGSGGDDDERGDGGRRMSREIWVSFSFNRESGESQQTPITDSDSTDSSNSIYNENGGSNTQL
ncbi:RING-type E3 ubiquitin transferase [Sarracenia purpurea var. burkii]